MTEKYLHSRVAMVTGGVSGMGRAIALALADNGADVVIGSLLDQVTAESAHGEVVHRPGPEQLVQTRSEIEARGVRAYASDLDVCSADSCHDFYTQALRVFGHVDILVNAAGITAENTLCGHSEALWLKVMDVNANGPFRMMRLALPAMIEKGWGRIINIASTAASVGAVTSGAYCASKAAVLGLTRCAAQEGAPHGISCNAISPGWVATDFQKKWMDRITADEGRADASAYVADTVADNPQKRMIDPREIGALAAFLCSDDAFGITGQDLTVSAGSLW
jgi:NAD(P)-dependent dehydrogenase (short-subunit alcohol dehydrogenase family)